MNYWASKEQLKAYEDQGLTFEEDVNNKGYNDFRARYESIQKDAENQNIKLKNARTEINSITRILTKEGNEKLSYNQIERYYDGLENPYKFSKTNVGTYGIPTARKELSYNPETNLRQTKIIGVGSITHSYYIDFSKDKLQELHKYCSDVDTRERPKTGYYVEKEGEFTITVKTYEDLLNGDFEELYFYGAKLNRKDKKKVKAMIEEAKNRRLRQIADWESRQQNISRPNPHADSQFYQSPPVGLKDKDLGDLYR